MLIRSVKVFFPSEEVDIDQKLHLYGTFHHFGPCFCDKSIRFLQLDILFFTWFSGHRCSNRAKYKILLLAHKIVHDSDSVTVYFCSSFSATKHSRITCFNLANMLKTEYSARLVTVGGLSIYLVLRDLWNGLPSVLRDNPSFQSYERSLKPIYSRRLLIDRRCI